MKAEEVRSLSDEELVKKLDEAHQEYFEMRLKAATKQLKNHREIPVVKKTIARIKTEMRQRQMGARQV